MKYYIFSAIVCSAIISCVSATVEVDSACATKTMDIPAAPINIGAQTISKDIEQDFSDVLGKIGDIGDASITTANLVFSGNVGFINRVKITLKTSNSPELLLADELFLPNNGTLTVPITADKNELLSRLKSGSVILHVELTGIIPTSNTPLDSTFCVGVSASVNKSAL